MDQDPDNKDVNKDLQEARALLSEQQKKQKKKEEKAAKKAEEGETKEKEKTKFRRVAIEEDSSDEEDADPKIEEVGGEKESAFKDTLKVTGIDSKFPLQT